MPTWYVEWCAVKRVFEHRLLAEKNILAKGLYWDGRGLDSPALLRAAKRSSSTERALGQLAAELWGYSFGPKEQRISLVDASGNMEGGAMLTVLEAVALRASPRIGPLAAPRVVQLRSRATRLVRPSPPQRAPLPHEETTTLALPW